MNWDALKIENVKSYKSNPRLEKKDRCKVELDMPIEEYSEFRRTVQAHHVLRDRRTGDRKPEKTPNKDGYHAR
jgi:hypothetical protein